MKVEEIWHNDRYRSYRVSTGRTIIPDLLKKLKPGQLGLVWGDNSRDEVYEYANLLRIRPSSADIIIANRPFSLASITDQLQISSRERKNRATYFLTSQDRGMIPAVGYGERHSFGEMRKLIESYSFNDIVDELCARFVRSRKQKEGADELMRGILATLEPPLPKGDIILATWRWPSYLSQIVIWKAMRESKSTRIVVARDAVFDEDIDFGFDFAERLYATRADLISAASEHFSMSKPDVERVLSMWIATNANYRAEIQSGKITHSTSESFLRIISGAEIDGAKDLAPHQRSAPLKFDVNNGVLDIQSNREYQIGNQRILGATRALSNSLDDLEGYIGMVNAVPTIGQRISRMRELIELIDGLRYDDGHIVQLGIELSSLQVRLYSAKSQIGDSAFAEGAAFLSVGFAFVSQFTSWNEFRGNARVSTSSSMDGFEEAEANAILREIVKEPTVATQTAVERVSSVLEAADSGGGPSSLATEGAIATAENAIVQAAEQTAGLMKREDISLKSELSKEIRKKSVNEISNWFVSRVGIIGSFAERRGLDYVKTIIENLS